MGRPSGDVPLRTTTTGQPVRRSARERNGDGGEGKGKMSASPTSVLLNHRPVSYDQCANEEEFETILRG